MTDITESRDAIASKNCNIFILQVPLCTIENLDCVSSLKVDKSDCLQKCSGMIVTSYDQHRLSNAVDEMVKFLSNKHLEFKDIASRYPGSYSQQQ